MDVQEKVADPKHFLSYPSYHPSNNDCVIEHLGDEKSLDMTCMLDDIFYVDDLPKFD